jgi:hypothetical protein
MPQTASSQQATRRQVCHLALTDPERRDLMRLMHRVLEYIEGEKIAYRVLAEGDPRAGHLLRDGEDITAQTLLDEQAARRFLALARLK